MGLIEKLPGAAGYRVRHTGTHADFESLFSDEASEPEIMSFTDWVGNLRQCFDPSHKGAGAEPAARASLRRLKQQPSKPAAAEPSQAPTTAAAQPLEAVEAVAGFLNNMSKTMGRARAFAPAAPAAPPKIGKIGRRALQAIRREDEALAQISTASPLQIATGTALTSTPSALRAPEAWLFATTGADTLDFSAQVPPGAEPLAVRDTLRILLLARRASREQIIPFGSLFPALIWSVWVGGWSAIFV